MTHPRGQILEAGFRSTEAKEQNLKDILEYRFYSPDSGTQILEGTV